MRKQIWYSVFVISFFCSNCTPSGADERSVTDDSFLKSVKRIAKSEDQDSLSTVIGETEIAIRGYRFYLNSFKSEIRTEFLKNWDSEQIRLENNLNELNVNVNEFLIEYKDHTSINEQKELLNELESTAYSSIGQ